MSRTVAFLIVLAVALGALLALALASSGPTTCEPLASVSCYR
jgi:hypothetical protein